MTGYEAKVKLTLLKEMEIIVAYDERQTNHRVTSFYFFQFYIMLNTIFAGNKINDFPQIEPSNYKEVTIFGLKQLRSSHSPQKVRTSKKFYYSIRNKSIKKIQEDTSIHQDLQTLIRKERIILMAQRSSLNDLILPLSDPQPKEAQLMMVLPTIDVRRACESEVKSNNNKKKNEKRGLIDIIDCKASFESNILRSKKNQYDTIANKKLNWPANKQNPEQKQQQRAITNPIPRISNKKSCIYSQSKCLSPVPKASQSYSPSKLKQVKSTFKLEQISSYEKKFKKGYLSYEEHGQQKWQKIKGGFQKQPLITIDPSKLVSAKAIYVYDIDQNQPILAYNQAKQMQIASLSKIMTCYLTILICLKYEIDMKNCYYRVPDKIPETPGTSAELTAGDLLNVEDLLYGLMLPSGNDASICLAELMGKSIQRHKKKQQKNSYFQTFMSQMNAFSKELDLNQKWNNSSGLPNNPNFSTPQAITALSALAIQNQLFKKIVTTKQIQLDIKNDRYGLVVKKNWKNTNKLLQKGWQGVKTGTTETAGHCLISKRQHLILSVFDCQTMNKRFTDSIRLYEYIAKIRQKS